MSTERRSFRRRQYIIKKGLQFRYIGVVFLLAILAAIVGGYTVFITGWTAFGEKLSNVYPQGRLVAVFKATNLNLLRNLLFASPLIFVLGLLSSHKIAGPVYRIEKTLYEIARGNLTPRVKLRKGDELWDLADIINTMAENLNAAMVSDRALVLNIQKKLDELQNAISRQGYDPKAIGSSVNALQAELKNLNASLQKWTTA